MEIPKSKYKGVSAYALPSRSAGQQIIYWQAYKSHNGKKHHKTYIKTEREAALIYDKFCLDLGLQPENILKRITV